MKYKYVIKTLRRYPEVQEVIECEVPFNKSMYKLIKEISFPYIDAHTDVFVDFYHDGVIQDKYMYITSRVFDGFRVIAYIFYGNHFEECILKGKLYIS